MKQHAPATLRNREPLASVLAGELPGQGRILEIASGTGEHAAFLAARFPHLTWQPSDRDEAALGSIAAYRGEGGSGNLLEPVLLDAAQGDWPVAQADAILCVNMVHISPWAATIGLFRGAASLLEQDAPLILYGPYIEPDVATAASNLEFDRSLRSRDERWGLRDLTDMDALAARSGFARTARHEMPANNLTLVFRRGSRSRHRPHRRPT